MTMKNNNMGKENYIPTTILFRGIPALTSSLMSSFNSSPIGFRVSNCSEQSGEICSLLNHTLLN